MKVITMVTLSVVINVSDQNGVLGVHLFQSGLKEWSR